MLYDTKVATNNLTYANDKDSIALDLANAKVLVTMLNANKCLVNLQAKEEKATKTTKKASK